MGEPPVFKDKIYKKSYFFSQGVGDTGTGGAERRAMGTLFFSSFLSLHSVRLV